MPLALYTFFPFDLEFIIMTKYSDLAQAVWVSGLLVWVLFGSGCLAAPASDSPRIGQDERGVGDFVLGSAGPDPAVYADRLPSCAGLDSPLSVCTSRPSVPE